jgi:hypothetical protein
MGGYLNNWIICADSGRDRPREIQVGNQGATNPKFRLSEEIVFNGYAGKINGATIYAYADEANRFLAVEYCNGWGLGA